MDVFKELKAILGRDISKISFDDNSYLSEDFFKSSIEHNFAGWYNETVIREQVDLILRTSKISPPASILDVGCGHGKHSALLASEDFQVTGIDISKTLINFLTERYQTNPNLGFNCCSISNIEYENKFDLVIILGCCLSLVPEPELRLALKNIRRSLKTDGKIFIEIDNRLEFIRREANQRNWNIYDNRLLVTSEYHYDDELKLEKTRDIGLDLESGITNEFLVTKRLYDPSEFRGILSESRYKIVSAYGYWDGRVLNDDTPYQIIFAGKS